MGLEVWGRKEGSVCCVSLLALSHLPSSPNRITAATHIYSQKALWKEGSSSGASVGLGLGGRYGESEREGVVMDNLPSCGFTSVEFAPASNGFHEKAENPTSHLLLIAAVVSAADYRPYLSFLTNFI